MIDKNVHHDQFRLKLLLTNQCNLNCNDCLNDFQGPSYNPKMYLRKITFDTMINSYLRLCGITGTKREIYLSGGEPTLSPNFLSFVKTLISFQETRVVINTNGHWPKLYHKLNWNRELLAYDFEESLFTLTENNVKQSRLEFHFGTHIESKALLNKILKFKGSAQTFLSNPQTTYKTIAFYANNGFKIKIFENFFGDTEHHNEYLRFIEKITKDFPEQEFEFRHTGIQTNRGGICRDCKIKCCTLKGIWVRGDDTVSPCPSKRFYDPLELPSEITNDDDLYERCNEITFEHIIKAYNFFQEEDSQIKKEVLWTH